jgi:deazaflavin-dependent oxidoreductase (nitroreductase family)
MQANDAVLWLLRSPMHRLMSGSTMAITYRGRKSGQVYSIPVNYVRDGNTFYTTSLRERTWWRNLRGGVAVTLLVKGSLISAQANVAEDPVDAAQQLQAYLALAPSHARFLQIDMSQGVPSDEDLQSVARLRVIVQCHIAE